MLRVLASEGVSLLGRKQCSPRPTQTQGGSWGTDASIPDLEPSPSMAQDLSQECAANRGSTLREGTRPEECLSDCRAGTSRADSSQATAAWGNSGPRRDCPGSGALGHGTERYHEVPAQRTPGLPVLGGQSSGPRSVDQQVIQNSFGRGNRYVLLFIYRGAWCSENSP